MSLVSTAVEIAVSSRVGSNTVLIRIRFRVDLLHVSHLVALTSNFESNISCCASDGIVDAVAASLVHFE